MEKYVKVRKIGQGSFGCAYLATRKAAGAGLHGEQQLVIKEVRLDPRDQDSAQREARLLAALDHPNIIACKESFLLRPPTSSAAVLGRHLQRPTVLCIVTEFADGGDLSQELERRGRSRSFFEPDELLGLFVQVCLALKHLHDRKILHRDVKPANIFLTKSGVVKLGDLGVATVLSHTLACAQTSIGTPYYTAPEICLGKRYNAKADVWSLGCVLFEMASFARAFEGRSQRQLFDNIVRGETPQLPARGSLSSIRNELQAMVGEMLRKEPRARPSVNQLIRRPLVLERIQGFLSARALASELNHTVLHGQSVFRKKLAAGEDKALPVAPPAAQHVRHAECVPRVSAFKAVVKPAPRQPQKPRKTPPHARNAKARVGSLLGASTRGRGLPQGALRRSRPIQKPARVPAGSNLNGAKQPAVPARARRQGALASAQVKARLKAQLQAAAVAALPDPPTTQKTKTQGEASRAEGKPPGRAERVAAFNAKWAAQREELAKHLPPPPPPAVKALAKKAAVGKKPKQAARGEPSPVVIGLGGRTPQAIKQDPPPPAPVNIRRQQAKQKAPSPAVIRDVQPSLRERRMEFQRKKQAEAGGDPRTRNASPLDDPIILVQQLPDFKTPPAAPTQEPALPPPAPSTLTSSLPDFADKDAELATESAQAEEGWDHELTSLPSMKNLEFERMILQLKSVVESDMTPSDDENDEEEQSGEVFDPNLPPPPYSPPSSNPAPTLALETLTISALEAPAFRSALQRRLQQYKLHPAQHGNVSEPDHFVVEPANQELLAWMEAYISSLL